MDDYGLFAVIGGVIVNLVIGAYNAVKARMANQRANSLPDIAQIKLELTQALATDFGEVRGKLENRIGELEKQRVADTKTINEYAGEINTLKLNVAELTTKYNASNEKIIKLVDEVNVERDARQKAEIVIRSLENEKLQVEKQLIANIAAKEAVLETLAVLHIRLQPTPPDGNGGGNGGGGGGKKATVSPAPSTKKLTQMGSDTVKPDEAENVDEDAA